MKTFFALTLFFISATTLFTQNTANKQLVEKACLNYIEGFYEGNTAKLKESLQPELNKFGFWKNKDTGEYEQRPHLSYESALAYAARVLENKEFPKADAPKKVEVFDIGNSIAAAKVTAWWGIDYMLLTKRGDKWMIEQVLWEGPYEE